MALASAAPWEVDAAVRRAAADALGGDPGGLPPADPRREKDTLRLTSALALRLARGSGADPARLAAATAARLEREDGIARASAGADGRLMLEPEPALFGALVRTARNGAFHLASGRHRAFPAPGAPGWALTDLCGLPSPAAARTAARDDARRRLRWLLEGERKDGESAERGEPAAEAGWREPLADRPCGDSATALLLAAVGEASARIAFCRSLSEHPRPGELTGPDLPALPTADAPGAWARFTADNPAFAVRYAHAHAVTDLRRAEEDGEGEDGEGRQRAPSALHPANGPAADPAGLVGALYDGPGAAAAAGRRGRPHMLVRYLEGLATAYHVWAETRDGAGGPGECAADRQDTRAAVCAVLGAGLLLLGVTAPTRL